MRILITGAGGLLGGRLCDLLAGGHDLVALARRRPPPEGIRAVSVDLADSEAVASILSAERPDAIIHCAALADPEICERDPEQARRNNVTATRNIARACSRTEARLISISTDLVFSGRSAFSSETAATSPLMEYGRSKRDAEAMARDECPDAVVLRVALICGRGFGQRLSASESLARRLQRGEEVTLYEDEWRTPIDPESVAAAIEAVLLKPGATGLFHVAGAERVSRAQLGARIAKTLAIENPRIRYASVESHAGAPRPKDVSLAIDRARAELGWAPRPLDAALLEGRLDRATSEGP